MRIPEEGKSEVGQVEEVGNQESWEVWVVFAFQIPVWREIDKYKGSTGPYGAFGQMREGRPFLQVNVASYRSAGSVNVQLDLSPVSPLGHAPLCSDQLYSSAR